VFPFHGDDTVTRWAGLLLFLQQSLLQDEVCVAVQKRLLSCIGYYRPLTVSMII
jgi:hypothetical protein